MTGDLSAEEQAVEGKCAALLLEMAGYRDFEVPPHGEDPAVVHEKLRDLRGRLDRAEAILAEVTEYSQRARRTAKRLAADADDAYDAALAPLSRAAVRREYESIRDREVHARTVSSPKRKEARNAERVADRLGQAQAAARGMFFGMRDIREELLATLRFLPWEAATERV